MPSVMELPKVSADEKKKRLDATKMEFLKRRRIELLNLQKGVSKQEVELLLKGFKYDNIHIENSQDDTRVHVLFASVEQARSALSKFNNHPYKATHLNTIYSQSTFILFVGNLPYDYTIQQFKDLVSSYGKVERTFLVYSDSSGHSKGYGYVEYINITDVNKAKLNLSKYKLSNVYLRVDNATYGIINLTDIHSNVIHVAGILPSTKSKEIEDLVQMEATVNHCQVGSKWIDGKRNCFAMIDVESVNEAEKVWMELDECVVGNAQMKITFAQPLQSAAFVMAMKPNKIPIDEKLIPKSIRRKYNMPLVNTSRVIPSTSAKVPAHPDDMKPNVDTNKNDVSIKEQKPEEMKENKLGKGEPKPRTFHLAPVVSPQKPKTDNSDEKRETKDNKSKENSNQVSSVKPNPPGSKRALPNPSSSARDNSSDPKYSKLSQNTGKQNQKVDGNKSNLQERQSNIKKNFQPQLFNGPRNRGPPPGLMSQVIDPVMFNKPRFLTDNQFTRNRFPAVHKEQHNLAGKTDSKPNIPNFGRFDNPKLARIPQGFREKNEVINQSRARFSDNKPQSDSRFGGRMLPPRDNNNSSGEKMLPPRDNNINNNRERMLPPKDNNSTTHERMIPTNDNNISRERMLPPKNVQPPLMGNNFNNSPRMHNNPRFPGADNKPPFQLRHEGGQQRFSGGFNRGQQEQRFKSGESGQFKPLFNNDENKREFSPRMLPKSEHFNQSNRFQTNINQRQNMRPQFPSERPPMLSNENRFSAPQNQKPEFHLGEKGNPPSLKQAFSPMGPNFQTERSFNRPQFSPSGNTRIPFNANPMNQNAKSDKDFSLNNNQQENPLFPNSQQPYNEYKDERKEFPEKSSFDTHSIQPKFKENVEHPTQPFLHQNPNPNPSRFSSPITQTNFPDFEKRSFNTGYQQPQMAPPRFSSGQQNSPQIQSQMQKSSPQMFDNRNPDQFNQPGFVSTQYDGSKPLFDNRANEMKRPAIGTSQGHNNYESQSNDFSKTHTLQPLNRLNPVMGNVTQAENMHLGNYNSPQSQYQSQNNLQDQGLRSQPQNFVHNQTSQNSQNQPQNFQPSFPNNNNMQRFDSPQLLKNQSFDKNANQFNMSSQISNNKSARPLFQQQPQPTYSPQQPAYPHPSFTPQQPSFGQPTSQQPNEPNRLNQQQQPQNPNGNFLRPQFGDQHQQQPNQFASPKQPVQNFPSSQQSFPSQQQNIAGAMQPANQPSRYSGLPGMSNQQQTPPDNTSRSSSGSINPPPWLNNTTPNDQPPWMTSQKQTIPAPQMSQQQTPRFQQPFISNPSSFSSPSIMSSNAQSLSSMPHQPQDHQPTFTQANSSQNYGSYQSGMQNQPKPYFQNNAQNMTSMQTSVSSNAPPQAHMSAPGAANFNPMFQSPASNQNPAPLQNPYQGNAAQAPQQQPFVGNQQISMMGNLFQQPASSMQTYPVNKPAAVPTQQQQPPLPQAPPLSIPNHSSAQMTMATPATITNSLGNKNSGTLTSQSNLSTDVMTQANNAAQQYIQYYQQWCASTMTNPQEMASVMAQVSTYAYQYYQQYFSQQQQTGTTPVEPPVIGPNLPQAPAQAPMMPGPQSVSQPTPQSVAPANMYGSKPMTYNMPK